MSDDYAAEEGAYEAAYPGAYGGGYLSGDGTTGGGMEEQPDDRLASDGAVWQPLAPGADFDAEATMSTPMGMPFSGQFPDAVSLQPGSDPLAAPGHGYVPPAQSYDSAPPLGAGQWSLPGDPAPQPDADGGSEQWSVPFAAEDPAEESGEYSVGMVIPPPEPPLHPDPAPPAEPALLEADAPPQPDQGYETADPAGADLGTGFGTGFDTGFDALSDGGFDAAGTGFEAQAGGGFEEPAPDTGFGSQGDTGGFLFPQEDPGAEAVHDPHSEHPTASYSLTVNGTERPVTDAWLGESLLYVLRERLGLAGAKDGCEQGECGACSVQVDGRLVASCLMPAATAAGLEVRTVEGLALDGQPSDVQRALAECGAVQCGFCVPGFAMTVHDLLEGNHRPTELETRQALSGNLCRCSGYQGVLDAVREVVAARGAAAEAAGSAHEAARIPHQSTGDPDGATP